MIPAPVGVRVWLASGVTDMRRGMNTLALQVQEGRGRDPQEAGSGRAHLDRRGAGAIPAGDAAKITRVGKSAGEGGELCIFSRLRSP